MGKIKIPSNVELLNLLRNTKNSTFEGRIPQATQDNIHTVIKEMDTYKPTWDELTGELVQKIGLQIMASFDRFDNPLKVFKKGDMPFGKTIEEIWIDLVPAQQYDPKDSETSVLKQAPLDIKTMYHYEDRENYYEASINLKRLRQAFYSQNGIFDEVSLQFTQKLFESDELDEYLIMRELFDLAIKDGQTTNNVQVIELDYQDNEQFAKMLAKVLRSTAKKLGFYSTSNIAGLRNVVQPQNQVIITTPEVEAMLDVDVLSHAFHMSKADTERLSIIDQFKDPDILAVVASKDLIVQYDTYVGLEPDIYNPAGLYRKYFYHHHGVYSYSKFEPLVIIRKSDIVTEPETRSLNMDTPEKEAPEKEAPEKETPEKEVSQKKATK